MLLRLAYVSWRNICLFFFFLILFRKGKKLVQKYIYIFLKEDMAFFFFCQVISNVATKN